MYLSSREYVVTAVTLVAGVDFGSNLTCIFSIWFQIVKTAVNASVLVLYTAFPLDKKNIFIAHTSSANNRVKVSTVFIQLRSNYRRDDGHVYQCIWLHICTVQSLDSSYSGISMTWQRNYCQFAEIGGLYSFANL